MPKLSEIFTLQMGKTPARAKNEYWNNGDNDWVSISDLSTYDKYVGETKETISDLAVMESGIKPAPADTVIMSFKLSLGKTAITVKPTYTNEAIMAFIPNGNYPVHTSYFYHFFVGYDWSNGTNRAVMGSTLNKATLSEIEITVPSIMEQIEIAKCLDKIDALISLRKQQLSKLDELVKSRFIELFGDPMANPMGWDRVNISAVVGGKVSNGFFAKRDDYCDGGNVKVLGVAHVVNRMYSNTEDLPTTNGTEADVIKYGVKYGDMLFCRSSLVAAGIGKASIVPKDTPKNVLFECHVIRLPLDLNKCVPEFMQVLSTTDYFRNQVIAQAKTATMTTIGQDGILKTDIILPPLEMQKKFLAFVEQTDKSKLAIQKSLEKLETLKKALMQKYFG